MRRLEWHYGILAEWLYSLYVTASNIYSHEWVGTI